MTERIWDILKMIEFEEKGVYVSRIKILRRWIGGMKIKSRKSGIQLVG